MAYKLDRVGNLIQKNVSEIIQFEMKEDVGMVTITRVRVVNDYSYAYIYVSFLNCTVNGDLRSLSNQGRLAPAHI